MNNQQVNDTNEFSSDYYDEVPMYGSAGLYSDQSAMDMAFTHLSLYRLPTPPDFWTAIKDG